MKGLESFVFIYFLFLSLWEIKVTLELDTLDMMFEPMGLWVF